VLTSWVRDSNMVFDRNAGYWNAPRPYVDELVVKPVVDETSRVDSYKSGGADLAVVTGTANARQLQQAGRGTMYPLALNGGVELLMNTGTAPFNDVRLRRAVALAIDRSDYAKVVDSG